MLSSAAALEYLFRERGAQQIAIDGKCYAVVLHALSCSLQRQLGQRFLVLSGPFVGYEVVAEKKSEDHAAERERDPHWSPEIPGITALLMEFARH